MAQEIHAQNCSPSAVEFVALKPQLVVPAMKADEAVQFYKAAFFAEELCRVSHPKRKAEQEAPPIISAELKIGSTSLLVCDQIDDSSPSLGKGGGSGIVFRLETDDVEGATARAVAAGAVKDGDIVEEEGVCSGAVALKVRDPFGIAWIIASVGKQKGGDVEA